jgi:hypothetical protein
VFDEDLFSPDDDEDHWTTSDLDGFMKAQREALAAKLEGDKRSSMVQFKEYSPVVPDGWQVVSHSEWPDTKIMKRGESRIWAISTGYDFGKIIGRVIRKASEAATPAGDGSDADIDGDDEVTSEAPIAATPEPEERARLTKAGQKMVAEAKTIALRAKLRDEGLNLACEALLAMLVVALTSPRVTVTMDTGYGVTSFRDLLPKLVQPDGKFDPLAEVWRVAAEALARILKISGPDESRDLAAEWIGHAIDAQTMLPRFDTPEFLAECKLPLLKAMAELQEGAVPGKTAKALREQLAGVDEGFIPNEAVFGAAGPKVI